MSDSKDLRKKGQKRQDARTIQAVHPIETEFNTDYILTSLITQTSGNQASDNDLRSNLLKLPVAHRRKMVLQMQRTIGNRKVMRLLSNKRPDQDTSISMPTLPLSSPKPPAAEGTSGRPTVMRQKGESSSLQRTDTDSTSNGAALDKLNQRQTSPEIGFANDFSRVPAQLSAIDLAGVRNQPTMQKKGASGGRPQLRVKSDTIIQREFDYQVVRRAITEIIAAEGEEGLHAGDSGHPSTYFDAEMPATYNPMIWNLYKALHWSEDFGQTRFTWARSARHLLSMRVDELIEHQVNGTHLLQLVDNTLEPILSSEEEQNAAASESGGGSYPLPPQRGPRVGETIAGQTFYATTRNSRERIAIRGPFTGREYLYNMYSGHRGLQYFGQSGWRDVVNATVSDMVTNGDIEENSYVHRVAQGMPLLGEGGLSAINTFDRIIFTLGLGFAGGRLNRVLAKLSGTNAGSQVSALPHFSGLRFDGSESIRFDLATIDRCVALVEDSYYARDFARAQILEYIAKSGFGFTGGSEAVRSHRESMGNEISEGLDPGVVGVATYLSHGASRYTPNPVADLRRARTIGGSGLSKQVLSRQVAVLLKLHAQRIARDRTSNPQLYNRYSSRSLTARLPNKIDHFVVFKRRSDPEFTFSYSAANNIIQGIRAGRGIAKWGPGSDTAPSGAMYLEHNGRYYSFGSMII